MERNVVRLTLLLSVAGTGLAACGQADAREPETERLLGYATDPERATAEFEPLGEYPSDYLVVGDFPGESVDAELELWQEQVPDIKDVEIASSVAEHEQPALFYAPDSDEERPLLMVLHSWSTNYQQNIDIPLAQFAVANDWAFIHPDFQGDNDGSPETTASDLVISDMEDALEYARENASVDESRIYLLGYSGGAMNALHLASRHPDTFAGVAAWVPVYDLVSWHAWHLESGGEEYAEQIAGACGGVPEGDSEAQDECAQRSPKAHVPEADGEIRVMIAHGIDDDVVPVEHSLWAFNDLVEESARLTDEQIETINESGEIADEVLERSLHTAREYPYFDEAEAPVLLHLQSGPAELVLFDGEHDMLYRPGLEWLARQELD